MTLPTMKTIQMVNQINPTARNKRIAKHLNPVGLNDGNTLAGLPIATISILFVTGITTGLQFIFPTILTALERTPTAAGASIAGAGLLGGLAFWLIARNRTPQGRVGGALILAGAMVLVFFKNIHGPPLIAGTCIAGIQLSLENFIRR
jgi:hypothetical protein